MNLDEIEEMIRRYLSAGVAVVIILVAPSTGDATGEPGAVPGGDPTVVTVDPERPADPAPRTIEPRTTEPRTTEPRTTEPRTTEPRAPRTVEPRDPGPRQEEEDEDDGAPTVTRTPDPDDEPTADEDTDGDTDPSGEPDLEDRGPADGSEPGIDDPEPGEDSDEPSTEDDEDAGDDEDTSTTTTTTTPRDPGPTTDTTEVERGPESEGTTAADRYGWGTPTQEDDFTSADLTDWVLYDGPGHAGEGTRSSEAMTVQDGVLTITGDAEGTTGGMAWGGGQQYGRWEGRVRAPAADPTYNALLLLWPDAEDWPVGGEIDFMEMLDPTRQQTDFFLHFGEDNEQIASQVEIDATEWHNWAVEWTPEAITGYVDGEEWFRSTDPTTFPPGPMHLCVQLDWFPEGSGEVQESTMEVEWVRQYALDDEVATEPAGSPVAEALETDPLISMFSWG